MTKKRFERIYADVDVFCRDHDAKGLSQLIEKEDYDAIVDLLNSLSEENEQLKFQLQNTSDQRDEFHRGARENANRVGKLEKENEQLRHDATILIQSNQDYRKENEELKEQLRDCEKFRHTVYQRISKEMTQHD